MFGVAFAARLDPVAFASEGVAGKCDAARGIGGCGPGDFLTGKPAMPEGGEGVVVWGRFGFSERGIEKHPGGRFEGELEGDTPYVFKLFAKGYAPLERTVTPKKDKDLELGTLVLSAGHSLTGRILEKGSRKQMQYENYQDKYQKR